MISLGDRICVTLSAICSITKPPAIPATRWRWGAIDGAAATLLAASIAARATTTCRAASRNGMSSRDPDSSRARARSGIANTRSKAARFDRRNWPTDANAPLDALDEAR
jgi:hypothetical protein